MLQSFVALFGRVAEGEGSNWCPLGSAGHHIVDDGKPQLRDTIIPRREQMLRRARQCANLRAP